MITGIGCDLSDVRRIGSWRFRFSDESLMLIFSKTELTVQNTASNPRLIAAVQFGLKEALVKALGGLDYDQWSVMNWTPLEHGVASFRVTSGTGLESKLSGCYVHSAWSIVSEAVVLCIVVIDEGVRKNVNPS